MANFKLSAQLVGHESDVRAATFASSDTVVTASRDCSVRIWRRSERSRGSFDGLLLSRGSEYVNAVAFYPPNAEHSDGLVVSGGKDTIIEVKNPRKQPADNAERLLVGHAHNVCALDILPNAKFLVSGGWDGQARVWDLSKWDTELMLNGHQGMAVWSVLALNDKTVVTGCADKNIRVFNLKDGKGGEVDASTTIYTPDVVRALCKVPPTHPSGADIANASSDGTIRLWKLNGQQIGELHGHESFVYSLTSLPSGELVSSGEDRTVRVWKGLECIQTITHPAISVWTVAANQMTGDIVSGASDGVARIFTRQPERIADEQTLKEFEESVKASSIPQQPLGNINKEKLPGPEFLQQKSGTKEGQVQMIKEANGNVTAHTWSMSQQQWINVGTVVDAQGSTGRKVEYQGKSYDFVFDVDIEDGKPPLKLPYNLSENPYERATKFLNDNELPLSYLDNVANFITENTKGATLGQEANSDGPDPYGTESRYRPGDGTQEPALLPQNEYLNITAAKYEAIFNKISNVNKTMISSGRKGSALNPGEESTLQSLRAALESSGDIPADAVPIVVKIVLQWPYVERLAGLDLLRCVARFHTAAKYKDHNKRTLVDIATAASIPSDETPNENAAMMGARALANLFSTADGRSLANMRVNEVLNFLERLTGINGGEVIGLQNRNLWIAASTMTINLAVLVNKEKLLSPNDRRRLLRIIEVVLKGQSDSEVLYRGFVALGTVLATSKGDATAVPGISEWVSEAASKATEDRVEKVAAECRKLVA